VSQMSGLFYYHQPKVSLLFSPPMEPPYSAPSIVKELSFRAHRARRAQKSQFSAVRKRPAFDRPLPADRISLGLILLVQPGLERREIIRQGIRVHLLLTGQRRQRLLPWLALPERQHFVQPLTRHFVVVNRAAMRWARISRLPA